MKGQDLVESPGGFTPFHWKIQNEAGLMLTSAFQRGAGEIGSGNQLRGTHGVAGA